MRVVAVILVIVLVQSSVITGINYGTNWWNGEAITALDAHGNAYFRGMDIKGRQPMPEGLGNVSKVFSTKTAFAALHFNRTVTVWGDGTKGGCVGESAKKDLYTCLPPNAKVKAIFANSIQFTAIAEDDTVFMWGRVPSVSIPAGLSGVKTIYNNALAWVALSHDDRVIGTWGSKSGGGSQVSGRTGSTGSTKWYGLYENLTEVVTIESTYYSFCALRRNATIWTWGRQYAARPTVNGLAGVVSISATQSAFAVILEDRHVVSWGLSHHGGLLTESVTDVRSLFSTDTAFAALHMDSTVTCWGSPGYGGQCDGVTNVEQIFGGPLNFVALLQDGSYTGWGHQFGFAIPDSKGGDVDFEEQREVVMALNGKYTSIFLRANGSVFTFGTYRAKFPAPPTDVVSIFSGDSVHAALTASGKVAYAERGYSGNDAKRNSTADAFPGAKVVTIFASTSFYPDSSVKGLYPCDYGTYGHTFGNCSACPAASPKPRGRPGFRSTIGSCIRCPPGNYSEDGLSCSHQCPAGSMRAPYDYFGNIDRSLRINHCEKCIPGYFNPRAGASKCTICPEGKYSSAYGALGCATCEAGKFATRASADCTACPANTTSLPGKAYVRYDCYLACPAGMFAQNSNGPCQDCFPGTFSTTNGSNSCLRCAKGHYKSSYGVGECSRCAPGSYSDVEGTPGCFLCPGGKYLAESGAVSSSACAACEPGFYSFPGSTNCRFSPPGSYTNESCSSDSILCPAGRYQMNSGSTQCQLAGPGRYSPSGSAVAISCPGGTFVETNGSTSASDCKLCRSGTFSAEGASQCTLCAKDDYAPDAGMRICKSCKSDEGYLMTGSEDRTQCVRDEVLASSLAGIDFVQLLFDRGVGLYGSAIIASVFLLAAAMITMVREKYSRLAQRRRMEALIHALQAGFSFGSEMFMIAGMLDSPTYALLGILILLSRLSHFFVGCLLTVVTFREGMKRRLEKLTVAMGVHDLHDHLDLEISSVKAGIVGLITLLSLCDVTFISFLPWKKNLLVEASKGYASIAMLKLCVVTKVLQSFVSLVCQCIFLAENNSAGARGVRSSDSEVAQVFFTCSIMASALSVAFGAVVLALKGELLGKLEKALCAEAERAEKDAKMAKESGINFGDLYKGGIADEESHVPQRGKRASDRLSYALNPLFGSPQAPHAAAGAAHESAANEMIKALRHEVKTLSEKLACVEQQSEEGGLQSQPTTVADAGADQEHIDGLDLE